MMVGRKGSVLGFTLAAALMAAAPASATSIQLGFVRITNTSGSPVANQLSVVVSDEDVLANQVKFVFSNSGPLASSITDVYFDDGSLLGIASVTNGAGVNFSQGASPGNLPGGNAIDFNTTTRFGNVFNADSNSPTQPNGVNPGESLTIVFNLIAGQTIDDTIAALTLSGTDPDTDLVGGLRIGLHVQAHADGNSDSYVNTPPDPGTGVPDGGATIALLGLGMMGLGIARRYLA